ncbi:MAG TPA: SHOCT domain-containing protein [Candidatus Nanoarchaeia archaeon]|nr:SHOCT domain-containing protein [Candidatus Nanoarchaeia archaeon]
MKGENNSTLWIILAVIFVVVLFLSFSFMGTGYGYGMMGSYGGLFGGWMILAMLFWVALFSLIFWLVYRLLLGREKEDTNALSVLKVRYARGEITKKQFEEMKKELM